MANFFAVFDRREQSGKQPSPQEFEGIKLGAEKTTAPMSTGMLEDACVLRVEGATTVAEVQRAVSHLYPGLTSGTVVVITEAAFKES